MRLLQVLACVFLLTVPAVVDAQIPPCGEMSLQLNSPTLPAPLLACPEGDGPTFADEGWSLTITVIAFGNPIAGIPASDFWLIDCNLANEIALCGGSNSASADGPTNAQGQTTMSLTTLAAGGCTDGLAVLVQGVLIDDAACNPICADVAVRSPDIDGNLVVDLADLAAFALGYLPNPPDQCIDMKVDGVINLADLAYFALHYKFPSHRC